MRVWSANLWHRAVAGRGGHSAYRAIVEPPKHEVVVPLNRHRVCLRCAVGFEVVAAVLERDAMFAFELFVVPLCDFGVCEQRVVAAGEASLHTLSDVVVERKVGAEGVVRVLPVAVLRLIDRLRMVSHGALHRILYSNATCLLHVRTHKPLINQMIIALDNESRIIEKVVNDLPIAPSTILIEQCKRRIPMEQHRRNLEVLLDELGDDIVVVLHALFVDRAFAEGEDARPGDREAERRHAEVLQAREVLLVEVVVRGGDVGGGVVGDLVDDAVAEEVPD